MDSYRIFDLVIASELQLPGLPRAGRGSPALRVVRGVLDRAHVRSFKPVFEWSLPGREPLAVVARHGDELLFSYPGQVHFRLSYSEAGCPGDVVECLAEPGCAPELQRHVLINQLLPRWLTARGGLALHASAALLPGLGVVAFLGPSGRGKSTLAASFDRHGAPLLADDCLLLRIEQGRPQAIGSFPGLRLWPDALEAGVTDDARIIASRAMLPDYDKRVIALQPEHADLRHGSGQVKAPAQGHRLAALCVLEEPATEDRAIEVRDLPGARTLVEMVASVFRFDPVDRRSNAATFRALGSVVGAPEVSLLSLRFPRDFRLLGEIRAALRDAVATRQRDGRPSNARVPALS